MAEFTKKHIVQRRKDGSLKHRDVWVPSKETKSVNRIFLRGASWTGSAFDAYRMVSPYATGAVLSKSLLDNVRPHLHNRHFYMTDLKNAFPSVDIEHLIQIVQDGPEIMTGPEPYNLAEFITKHATSPEIPGLPTGSPASPLLFNIYCRPMDMELGKYCTENDIAYTRYLDDLTFSAAAPLGYRRRAVLRDIIQATPGMRINDGKSHIHSLKDSPVTITGVSLYPDGRMEPSPQLMETAKEVFKEIGDRALAGQFVLKEDIGQLHGYHGAIMQLSSRETPAIRQLDKLYQRALGAIGAKTL